MIAELQNNAFTGANVCFNLRQVGFALVILVSPGTASHAANITEGDGDSESELNKIGVCDLTQVMAEPAPNIGNGVETHEPDSPDACITVAGSGHTRTIDNDITNPGTPAFVEYPAEPFNTGWALVLDNDALISGSRDEDYTGGFSFALGGERVTKYRLSLDPALTWLNKKLRLGGGRKPATLDHLMQFGLTLFTPDLGSAVGANIDDRPFANLLYLENSQFRVNAARNRAYQTTLTVGILGSDAGEIVQNAIHHVTGNAKISTSGHQISDGGELTARYAVSMQSLLQSRNTGRDKRFELKYRVEGDIGYITEGSVSLAARWGQVENPWWSFAPTRSNYLPQPVPISRKFSNDSGRRDFFLWSAMTLRARAYNALLQGQFRDSEITFSGGELNHILGELSVGLNKGFGNAVNVILSLHYQTDEIRHNDRSSSIRWGGLTIHKSF